MIKTNKIAWAPFSDKHKTYIKNAIVSDFCVAEGAIRSGKTIDNCIIAAAYLETSKDKIHLASGSTLGNAKLNIGECNGYGLEHLFRGRCYWGKFKDNPALIIQTKTGEKIVVFAGGAKADSYKKILGNSYGLWIATEINEHYDTEESRESFIKVAMGRQIAAKSPKTLWDLNPCHPADKIYKDYIDKYHTSYEGKYLYEHFTISDNASITPERLALIKSKYTEGTVWYNRDILGMRTVSAGLVYRYLADDIKKYSKAYSKQDTYNKIVIGIDYGGNKSMTTFVAVGFNYYKDITVLAEHSLPTTESIDSDDIVRAFSYFYESVSKRFGAIAFAFGDNASPTLNNQLEAESRRKGYSLRVAPCQKLTILRRVQLIDLLLKNNRLKFLEGTEKVRTALTMLRWDTKKEDTIEDKNLDNCNDWFDSFCYSFTSFAGYFERGY